MKCFRFVMNSIVLSEAKRPACCVHSNKIIRE